MALYSTRKKQRELAEREAQGESFWTETFNEAFRNKIFHYILRLDYMQLICETAHSVLVQELGVLSLNQAAPEKDLGSPVDDVLHYLLTCSDEELPDVLEAFNLALRSFSRNWDYQVFVKEKLMEHRIAFNFVDGQMVEKKSQELHVAVVEPALTLLASRPEFRDVERAYQDALGELSDQKPADALTDAGTALQAMLTQLGCTRKTLGEQIKEAKDKGLFAGHDTPLLNSITGLLQWVAGERNQRSDAHNVVDVPLSEGWLMVHVVGAIIVMLAQTYE